jgi:hypothetical protein
MMQPEAIAKILDRPVEPMKFQGRFMISTAVNKEIVRRFYEKVFDRQSIEAIDELVPPEFIDRDLTPSASREPESMKQFIKTLTTS